MCDGSVTVWPVQPGELHAVTCRLPAQDVCTSEPDLGDGSCLVHTVGAEDRGSEFSLCLEEGLGHHDGKHSLHSEFSTDSARLTVLD